MIELGPISIESVIVCEQVRPELAGKFTIIGALVGDISVPTFPAQFGVSAFATARSTRAGTYAIKFRVSSPGQQGEMVVEGQMVIAEPGRSAIALPALPAYMPEAGTFKIEMAVDGSDWATLAEPTVRAP